MSHRAVCSLVRFAVAVCFFSILASAHANEGKPLAVTETNSHDFGSVFEGTAITHDFIIKNTGGADLKIKNVYTG